MEALRGFLPAIVARMRVHRLSNSDIYTITWSFSSPDGRATFHLDEDEDENDSGEPLLVWRRFGDHGIYREP
jgi:hypothetical protein